MNNKIINLFLIDMSSEEITTGVDRYMEVLINGLKDYLNIKVHWIHLKKDDSFLFYKEERIDNYLKISIPLPQQFNEILSDNYWLRKYNKVTFQLINSIFQNKENIILHLHSLNLIDLAMYIKEQVNCKIITHLHCIPWKYFYNINKRKFNYLYEQTYLNNTDTIDFNEFITNNCEFSSYHQADHVVCVTNCAKDFLMKVMQKDENSITIIQNGMDDYKDIEYTKVSNNIIELIYVGTLTASKGIYYVLEALREVKQRGYRVSLTIAGKYDSGSYSKITKTYKDITLNILGVVSFNTLKEYYQKSDIGVIASLQEQASYVAIEMAMFGLPIITTNVDGLDEIFTDNSTALKVHTEYSKVKGLSVNVPMLADKIIDLIENKEKRKKIGNNARKLYEEKLSLNKMLNQTVDVYKRAVI